MNDRSMNVHQHSRRRHMACRTTQVTRPKIHMFHEIDKTQSHVLFLSLNKPDLCEHDGQGRSTLHCHQRRPSWHRTSRRRRDRGCHRRRRHRRLPCRPRCCAACSGSSLPACGARPTSLGRAGSGSPGPIPSAPCPRRDRRGRMCWMGPKRGLRTGC